MLHSLLGPLMDFLTVHETGSWVFLAVILLLAVAFEVYSQVYPADAPITSSAIDFTQRADGVSSSGHHRLLRNLQAPQHAILKHVSHGYRRCGSWKGSNFRLDFLAYYVTCHSPPLTSTPTFYRCNPNHPTFCIFNSLICYQNVSGLSSMCTTPHRHCSVVLWVLL